MKLASWWQAGELVSWQVGKLASWQRSRFRSVFHKVFIFLLPKPSPYETVTFFGLWIIIDGSFIHRPGGHQQ
jgi:hypothetical protein